MQALEALQHAQGHAFTVLESLYLAPEPGPGSDRAGARQPLIGAGDDDFLAVQAAAQCDLDRPAADVVAFDPLPQGMEVEGVRRRDAGPGELLVEVDLWSRAVQALEEPLETQQLLVSSSTEQLHFEEGEVLGHRMEFGAGGGAGRGQDQREQPREVVGAHGSHGCRQKR